jgi:tRNA-2-methylthio-N6-dimethylallyladenosine synthase
MNRYYTRDHYLRLIDELRDAVPGIDISTDIMVGFPGETEKEFLETMFLVREVRFATAFMFAYSIREGTAAASMGGQVDEATRKERLAELIEVQTAITKEHYACAVGRTVPVLFTHRQERRGGEWMGQDYGCKRVLLACDLDLTGTIFDVEIIESSGMTLIGKEAGACAS